MPDLAQTFLSPGLSTVDYGVLGRLLSDTPVRILMGRVGKSSREGTEAGHAVASRMHESLVILVPDALQQVRIHFGRGDGVVHRSCFERLRQLLSEGGACNVRLAPSERESEGQLYMVSHLATALKSIQNELKGGSAMP